MKKILLVLLLAMCASAVFAFDNKIDVKIAPIAIQVATSSCEEEHPIRSNYGFDAEVSYKRMLTNAFFVEGGLSYGFFILPEGRPVFDTLFAFAGIGYEYRLCDLLSIIVHADAGCDTLFYYNAVSGTFTLKPGAGVGFNLSERLKLTAGCDGTFGFCRKEGKKYVNYRIIPTIGMSIGL